MAPSITLFCLPYAGGNANIFRDWQARMPDWIHVVALHLPARGRRQQMAPISDWPALMNLLAADVAPYLSRPFAIFGHSMGALVGIELAREIHRRYNRHPLWLCVSACAAPSRRDHEAKWLDCPQAEVIEEIRSLNGTADDLLQNQELMGLLLPMLRADFHLCGTYTRRMGMSGSIPALLSAPLSVLAGRQDTDLTDDPEKLAAWREETSGPLELKMFDGGHFFVHSHADEIAAIVSHTLGRLRPVSASA